MHFDFAAFLVLATALTGIVWLIDRLAFAKARGERKEPVIVEYARSFFPVLLIVLVVLLIRKLVKKARHRTA